MLTLAPHSLVCDLVTLAPHSLACDLIILAPHSLARDLGRVTEILWNIVSLFKQGGHTLSLIELVFMIHLEQ